MRFSAHRNKVERQTNMTDLVERAKAFATKAHAGQFRKYTGEEYIKHPEQVVKFLGEMGVKTPEVLAAAWLHDVVEDTPATMEDIYAEFGELVGDLVFWLTDTLTPEDGNRAFRKAKARERLTRAPLEAQQIKLADFMSNGPSIAANDPDFWVVFKREVLETIEVMTKPPREDRLGTVYTLYYFDPNF